MKNGYDTIIIGAGASGLYCAANFRPEKTKDRKNLIIEASSRPGLKLLMSGSGQCNLTHGGNMKDFICHYGNAGNKIRKPLYRHNNLAVMHFFEKHSIELWEREDGKVFPKSMDARDILNLLVKKCEEIGWKIYTGEKVNDIVAMIPVTTKEERHVPLKSEFKEQKIQEHQGASSYRYQVVTHKNKYVCKNLIVATGGCSYPNTGSDGSMFPILKKLGLQVQKTQPALAPVFVENYPYGQISGLSFHNVKIEILEKTKEAPGKNRIAVNQDALLLTHNNFSGPAILNISRYAKPGYLLKIRYCSEQIKLHNAGVNQSIENYVAEQSRLPKSFIRAMLQSLKIEHTTKTSTFKGSALKAIEDALSGQEFFISGVSGFDQAMVTKGGVSLQEIDLKTFGCKNRPGLSVIGEALDVDGDTGGYNLQWAFSSGFCASMNNL